MHLAAPVSNAPRIGRFRLRRKIGAGLQGTVYLAEDPELERPVAVKLLQSDEGAAAPADEGRSLGRLRHPNVVSVFESGLHRGHRFLVFEYVDGDTLASRLRGGQRLPAAEALPLFRRVVEGVAHAHAQGVIHLDLNPNNIMIDRHGVPRIMDFGLARRDANRDAGGLCAGTPLFMAPEQFDGGTLGPHTDVYALGLILYLMLTGQYALNGERLVHIAETARRGDYDFGGLLASGVGPAIEPLVRAMLATPASARIADANELLRRLDDALADPAATPAAAHGTVEFLLRRMRLRKELPALSSTLLEVNRLTADDSLATPARLAQVVLRDYALANRLLRLANSAYFGGGRAPITTVSEAVVRLGFDQVRVACNALLYVGRLESVDERASRLVDLQVEGFVAGLIARHLARDAAGVDAEAAFLCGMFRRLGETLAAYCFPEESDAIDGAVRAGASPDAAFLDVLGLAPHELGAGVAHEWKLPEDMAQCMAPLQDPLPVALDGAGRLHAIVALAEELAWLLARQSPEAAAAETARLAARYAAVGCFDADALERLARAAATKFREFASVVGLRGRPGRALDQLAAWDEGANAAG